MGVWSVETLKALHEQRFEALAEALELKSAETARRLDILNHAHEKAVEVQHTYVPREVFEATIERIEAKFAAANTATAKALTLREGQSSGVRLTANAMYAALVVLIAIAGVVIAVITR